jgi:hypothetical protein
MRKSFIVLTTTAVLLSACGGPKDTVTKFLDAVIAKQPYSQFLVPQAVTQPVTSYNLVSYEIKNVSNSEVSVLVVFSGTRGNGGRVDMPETHVFRLVDNKIKEID